jgi:hypothetical protein
MDIRAEVIAQIRKLNKVLALLDEGTGVKQGRPRGKRRELSAAARKRISDAQKKRWAAARSK